MIIIHDWCAVCIAIPVQMAVLQPGQSRQSPIWQDGILDCCNRPQQFFWCSFIFPWLQWADNVHRARLMDKCAALITFGIAWCMFWVGFGIYGYFFFVGWYTRASYVQAMVVIASNNSCVMCHDRS